MQSHSTTQRSVGIRLQQNVFEETKAVGSDSKHGSDYTEIAVEFNGHSHTRILEDQPQGTMNNLEQTESSAIETLNYIKLFFIVTEKRPL